MRARGRRRLGRQRKTAAGPPEAAGLRRAQPGALVFLRGREADGRLRDLLARRTALRPGLAALAVALLDREAFKPLGFRSLGDWSRERIGVGARAVREWARVWRALGELPRLRQAVCRGELSWSVARKVVGFATPETEGACLEDVRGRTLRAVEAMVRAVKPERFEEVGAQESERVAVRVPCRPSEATRWVAACELARHVAGEDLPIWECAEAILAEYVSAAGTPAANAPAGARSVRRRSDPAPSATDREPGLRALLWPHLRWKGHRDSDDEASFERLAAALAGCSPRDLDRRMRAAIVFRQAVDFEIGRILKQMLDRKLHRELGFESFERYVAERLDLSPRTARRLMRLVRAEHTVPTVANAFREGRITLLQAEVLLRGGTVGRALAVTLRRLRDEVPQTAVAFSAPREVADLFGALVREAGLGTLVDHAIATWLAVGQQFKDYADFERDGFRCTVPACSARRNLESHHIRFRSRGGPDEAWNRTTLCAFHHRQGVHGAHRVRIWGRAPGALRYELGVGRFRSYDVYDMKAV